MALDQACFSPKCRRERARRARYNGGVSPCTETAARHTSMARTLRLTVLVLGGLVAVGGGFALAVATLMGIEGTLLAQLERSWLIAMAGLLVSSAIVLALGTGERATPIATDAAVRPATPAGSEARDAAAALHQMRAYIGLEMWDLAVAKAESILARFPGTTESETVARVVGELRWKAEPKPAPSAPATPSEQAGRENIARLLQNVRTYMDLEMYELAREKAQAVLALTPGHTEASRVLTELERRGVAPPPPPVGEPKR
jgi:hypothetical protein